VIGAIVILFDPIFQGLAVALITGAIASTILTLIVVPGIYYLMKRPARQGGADAGAPVEVVGMDPEPPRENPASAGAGTSGGES